MYRKRGEKGGGGGELEGEVEAAAEEEKGKEGKKVKKKEERKYPQSLRNRMDPKGWGTGNEWENEGACALGLGNEGVPD